MLSQKIINQTIATRLSPILQKTNKESLLIHEIYSSIQGESSHMGLPCVFVRTTGCHLRCSYCDTEQAFFNGIEMELLEVISKIRSFKIKMVELTGGEPLLQKASFLLLKILCDLNHTVLLETSGAVSIKNVDQRVHVILDVKTPSSGESSKNVWHNLKLLWPGCEVKFVVSDFKDYEYAKKISEHYDLYNKTTVLISPVTSKIDPKILAEKVISDKINVRFQMQLHRILWGEEPGR